MRCPYCSADATRVIDSRRVEEGASVRRRRSCDSCSNRFTTYERVEAAEVVKRGGHREPFSPDKIRSGLERALTDRPLPTAAVDGIVSEVETAAAGGSPITTDKIGKIVLERLKATDEVAYLRFVSVYKEFEGLADFEAEMAQLED